MQVQQRGTDRKIVLVLQRHSSIQYQSIGDICVCVFLDVICDLVQRFKQENHKKTNNCILLKCGFISMYRLLTSCLASLAILDYM